MLARIVNFYWAYGSKKEKRKLSFSIALVLSSSFIESATFLMALPLIGYIGGASDKILLLRDVVDLGLSEKDFFAVYVVVYMFFVLLSALLGILSIRSLSAVVSRFGMGMASRTLSAYLNKDWLDFSKKPVTDYANFLTYEIQRLMDNVLQPTVQILSRIVSVLIVSIILISVSPYITLLSFLVFGIFYGLIYFFLKPKLVRLGAELTSGSELRASIQKDTLSMYKEAHLLNGLNWLLKQYKGAGDKFGDAYYRLNILYNSPRYLVEGLVFLGFGGVVLWAVINPSNGDVFPLLMVFGLASVKLLPAFQMIYSSLARVRGNIGVLDSICKEIEAVRGSVVFYRKTTKLNLIKPDVIELKSVRFTYPGSKNTAINKISLTLPQQGLIGVIGKSGSGKSTFIDLLLGFLKPESGNIFANYSGLDSYSFVPQSTKLVSGSVIENIVFGEYPSDSVRKKVNELVDLVGLTSFVGQLDRGLDTVMSSDGYGISGGQLQRLGIARALYKDCKVLILDEPTSALDQASESAITSIINTLSANILVIVIAHRLSTLGNSDRLLVIENGLIAAYGKPKEVFNSSAFYDYQSELKNEK